MHFEYIVLIGGHDLKAPPDVSEVESALIKLATVGFCGARRAEIGDQADSSILASSITMAIEELLPSRKKLVEAVVSKLPENAPDADDAVGLLRDIVTEWFNPDRQHTGEHTKFYDLMRKAEDTFSGTYKQHEATDQTIATEIADICDNIEAYRGKDGGMTGDSVQKLWDDLRELIGIHPESEGDDEENTG